MYYQQTKKYGLMLGLCALLANTAYAQINVFACEPEWAALTRSLGGDAVRVFSATTAQQDPHHIQARPSLIAKVRRADLLICTGAELEVGWLPLLLRKSGNGKIQPHRLGHFMAAKHVALLDKPAVLDRRLGDIHASGNPHVHFDPYRILQIAKALAARLGEIDAANQTLYQHNLRKFSQTWQQALAQWEQRAQPLRGQSIVVNHNNWLYLEQWLELTRVATLESKPGIPPSSTHLSKVLTVLQHNPATMILTASYQNDQAARWLSKKTGIPVARLPYSVSRQENLVQWFDRLLQQLLAGNA